MRPTPLSRREFLTRAGLTAFGAALLQLPGVMRAKGWLDEAAAQDADLTRDTFNGLVALIIPGRDAYSVAQGESSTTPGGIDARTPEALIENLDRFVPAPDLGPFSNDDAVPLSGAVANMLNSFAAQVDPAAAGGPFPSHFSRLSFAKKVEVFRRIEATRGEDDLAGTLRLLGAVLPAFVGLFGYSEWGVFDPVTRTATQRPVGWNLTGYMPGRTTPADGWPELRGYFRGRRRARGGRGTGRS